MTRALILLASLAAWGQAPKPVFEVASVKPSPEVNGGRAITELDTARIRLRQPLQKLICTAYQVRADQVSGPAWLETAWFDIEATLPNGATADQIPSMLQRLLTDRFHLAAHLENREKPVYALVVAKGGLKMHAKPGGDRDPLPPPPSYSCAAPFSFGLGTITSGDRKTVMAADGMIVEMSRVATLIDLTTRLIFADRPIIDKTNLRGGYDIRLDFPLSQGNPSDPAGAVDPLFTRALDKLGLKLEPQKALVDTIVIDSIEKTPVED